MLHLRRAAGVVKNIYYPWKRSESGKFPILTGENRSVDLNQGSKNLEGITLGRMQGVLEWGHCNTVREKLKNLFSTPANLAHILQSLLGQHAGAGGSTKGDIEVHTLPQLLDQITKLRNGHAHISTMSRQKFGELRNLVLPSKPRSTSQCLFIILLLKAFVLNHWARIDFPTEVTTEDGQIVEFKNYNKIIIRSDGSNWKLVAIHGDGSELCIATFDTKDDAETARTVLDKAAGTDKTWDVREFKQNLETDR